MTFRNFLFQQLLPLVKDNRENINYQNLKTEIFFFQIGCYPSNSNNLHHECHPYLLECQKENVNVNLVCLDNLYLNFLENTPVRNRILDFSFPTFIYEKNLTEEDYICLIEFCHFIGNFSCLSIVNEYTGIDRKQFYQEPHQTDYLYISPSSCQVEKSDRLSHPLLILEVMDKLQPSGDFIKISKYYWKTFRKIESLYQELDFTDIKKVAHLQSIIDYYCGKVSSIYVRILNLLDLEEFKILKNSVENNNLCDITTEKLLEKFLYDKYEVKILLSDFVSSNFQMLEVFLKKRISFILIAALHSKCHQNIDLIKKYNSYLIFNSTSDILNNILFLEQ